MDKCAYCSGKMSEKHFTKEHILPKSICDISGINKCDKRNVTRTHKYCNMGKGNCIHIPGCYVMSVDLRINSEVEKNYSEFLYENLDKLINGLLKMKEQSLTLKGYDMIFPWRMTSGWTIDKWIEELNQFRRRYEEE